LLQESLSDVTFATTQAPGDERALADRAIGEGYDVVVAVGGDGTWSSVADRILASGRKDVALGILPSGTGNDFGRNFGYDPRSPQSAVRVLAAGNIRQVDVGRVDSPSAHDLRPDVFEPHYFLNVVGFGFDIAVIDAAAKARFLRGELLYKVTALQQLSRFRGFDLELDAAGGERRTGHHLILTVSNGRYFGGGFPIAPNAMVTDGLLHACLIRDASPFRRFQLFNKAEKGRHLGSPEVDIVSDTGYRLTFAAPPRFEVDGDVRQAQNATVELSVIPGGLKVVAPAH
jgi:YegS/Rv2252/BmrU family lipid kinase